MMFCGQILSISLKLSFLLCCCYMLPSAQCRDYTWPMLTAKSIWKSFLKDYSHYLMLLAINGEI